MRLMNLIGKFELVDDFIDILIYFLDEIMGILNMIYFIFGEIYGIYEIMNNLGIRRFLL